MPIYNKSRISSFQCTISIIIYLYIIYYYIIISLYYAYEHLNVVQSNKLARIIQSSPNGSFFSMQLKVHLLQDCCAEAGPLRLSVVVFQGLSRIISNCNQFFCTFISRLSEQRITRRYQISIRYSTTKLFKQVLVGITLHRTKLSKFLCGLNLAILDVVILLPILYTLDYARLHNGYFEIHRVLIDSCINLVFYSLCTRKQTYYIVINNNVAFSGQQQQRFNQTRSYIVKLYTVNL